MRQLEVRLKPWERRMLISLRERPPSPRVGRRAMCLLLSAAGEPARQIARVTGMSLDAVTDVRRRWRSARGSRLRSLLDQPRTGRPAKGTAAYRRELLPHVVRCWMRKGQQKQVKTPGKNRRLAAFGALGYGHHAGGLFLHHTQPRKTAWGMRALAQRLLWRARRNGRRIVLVLDRGN